MLTQYRELKQRYPDAVLLFCVGKNYEAYCTDADNCSEILKLERTRRELNGCYQPIPCV